MTKSATTGVLLSLLGAFALAGCAGNVRPTSTPTTAAKTAEVRKAEPAPKPVSLDAEMEGLSSKADDPDLSDAQATEVVGKMSGALDRYFSEPVPEQDDPKLQGAVSRMCDQALQIELDANAAPADAEDESPKDDLLHITTFVSAADLKKTYLEVEKNLNESKLGFAIPTNKAVLTYVNLYQTKLHDWFQRALDRGAPYIPKMQEIFRDEGVPPSLVYLAIVESAFNPNAVSRARAVGMWQFIAGTARRYDLKVDFWQDQRRDPEMAARASARYLKDLYGMFHDWQLALAAYNGGEGKIQRYLQRHPDGDFWSIRKTRYIRRQTREYVPAILAAILLASNPQAYGFTAPADPPIQPTAMVSIDKSTDIRVLARCAQIPAKELEAMNPSLRRLITPPGGFQLRIPANRFTGFKMALAKVPDSKRVPVTVYTVRRGDNLGRIARHYKVSVGAIRLANRIRGHMIFPRQKLIIPLGLGAADPTLYRESHARRSYRGGRVYRVRRGDTLSGIASRTGVPVYRLKSINNLRSDMLRPGQRLVLRGGSGGSEVAMSKPRRNTRSRGGERIHRVRRGDTLSGIARRTGVPVYRLKALNNLSSDVLHPGQRLVLGGPSGGSEVAMSEARRNDRTRGGERIHHVRQGDTLWDLARRYGTTVDRICRANRISRSHRLRLGDTLLIPE